MTTSELHWVALAVFVGLFLFVTVLGFVAARWKAGGYGAVFEAAAGISPAQEAAVAKIVSLLVKLGALLFVLFLPTQHAMDLQLLGGIWILQIFPAVVLGLYRMPLYGRPLFLGWVAGKIVGTWSFVLAGLKPVLPIQLFGGCYAIYVGVLALVVNLVIGLAGSKLATLGVQNVKNQHSS